MSRECQVSQKARGKFGVKSLRKFLLKFIGFFLLSDLSCVVLYFYYLKPTNATLMDFPSRAAAKSHSSLEPPRH